jgi:hypothetical protein
LYIMIYYNNIAVTIMLHLLSLELFERIDLLLAATDYKAPRCHTRPNVSGRVEHAEPVGVRNKPSRSWCV